jgi:hypothetical protein
MTERLFPVDGPTPTERAERRTASRDAQASLFSDADFAIVPRGELSNACPVCASTEHTGRFGCPHGTALALDLDGDDQGDDLDGFGWQFLDTDPPEWRTEYPHRDDRRRIESCPDWLRELNHDWQPVLRHPDINEVPFALRLACCPRRYFPQSSNPYRRGTPSLCIRCGHPQSDHPTEGDTTP